MKSPEEELRPHFQYYESSTRNTFLQLKKDKNT